MLLIKFCICIFMLTCVKWRELENTSVLLTHRYWPCTGRCHAMPHVLFWTFLNLQKTAEELAISAASVGGRGNTKRIGQSRNIFQWLLMTCNTLWRTLEYRFEPCVSLIQCHRLYRRNKSNHEEPVSAFFKLDYIQYMIKTQDSTVVGIK